MARIKFCERSTITEAWALVVGLPAPVDDTDAAVLARAAKDSIDGLQPKSAIVVVHVQRDLAPPFWTQQLSWENDKHLARFGHRYLSVHYLRPQGEHYREYSKTLKPGVDSWLEAYNEAFRKTAREHAVNIVGFGYVNTFDFEPKDFDLSTYFKLNFGVDVGSNDTGLLGLNTGFQFYDASREMYLSLTLAAASPTSENSAIQVVTKVVAERRGVENLSFGDKKELGDTIYEAKEAAKETFFGFATPKTHAIMGAVSDATQ